MTGQVYLQMMPNSNFFKFMVIAWKFMKLQEINQEIIRLLL